MDGIKVLQVVGEMNRGGMETWLMHVLRHLDRDRFRVDFLVHADAGCAYDEEIVSLGSGLFRIRPSLKKVPAAYTRRFRKVLGEGGPYHVLHSHVHYFSGMVLRLAAGAGVKERIAHIHIDTAPVRAKAGAPRRLFMSLMRKWVRDYATVGLAASTAAAASFFGSDWKEDPRWRVLHCGIDLEPFKGEGGRKRVREELGIPGDSLVIGHVGRFQPQKNHAFILRIAVEAAEREHRAFFLLVGDGPLRGEVERRAREMGLGERVVFAGERDDVPRMMRAMDAFLLPSLYEGLPLALLEAQASALPCVVSENVSPEAQAVEGLVRRVSLEEPPSTWAEEILRAAEEARGTGRALCLEVLEKSDFNIVNSVKKLEELYENLASRRG